MRLLLKYQPFSGTYDSKTEAFRRTHFVHKIMNETKIHTIRSMKYRGVEYPREARHCYVGLINKDVITNITGIEELEIIYLSEDSDVYKRCGYSPLLVVEGRQLTAEEAMELAKNDGFNSWHEFKQWFDSDDSRILMHFTERRYGVE